MTFTYRNTKGSELTYSELDENFQTVENLHDATQALEKSAAESASNAAAAANYKGTWTGKTGAATMPASYSHLGKFWALAVAIPASPGIQTKTPGTASEFVEIPLGSWSTLSGKPAVVAAGATAADARAAIGAANAANVVNSLNGETGALVKTTLAGYGITNVKVGHLQEEPLPRGAVTGSGFYRIDSENADTPPSFGYCDTFVSATTDTFAHIAVEYNTGRIAVRGGVNQTINAPWNRISQHSEVKVGLSGGAIDCALGNTFTETVSANRTLAFSNIPTGAYSCVLEINHTAGAITFPAGTVWAGTAPTLTAGKRHLFFFQRAQLGTAGWYARVWANYSI